MSKNFEEKVMQKNKLPNGFINEKPPLIIESSEITYVNPKSKNGTALKSRPPNAKITHVTKNDK